MPDQERPAEQLEAIEWLLTKTPETGTADAPPHAPQPYGDLVQLNTNRVIAGSVSEGLLSDIVDDYLDLLESSAAVYETSGDYALGIFTSGWCRFMDERSRASCGTADNTEALRGGQWHCHESCWQTSKASIETGQPADFPCKGGIHIYAVPIRSGNEIVGSINFGYGDPPRDSATLHELAERYGVPVEELSRRSAEYQSRPPFLIQLAKQRLHTSARLLGAMIEQKRHEEREHKRAADVMAASLREKETLLKEIHHRVKNNLAVISSLFYLESTYTTDKPTISVFQESQRRVRAMALVHETLYGSGNLAELDFGAYAHLLATELATTYGRPRGRVQLRMDVQALNIGIDVAVPSGLILNELMSNAFKHAFPSDGPGEIVVTVRAEPGGRCVLQVSDDGVGLPANLDLEHNRSLGLRLIRTLVRQIRGSFEFVPSTTGTKARLTFANDTPKRPDAA